MPETSREWRDPSLIGIVSPGFNEPDGCYDGGSCVSAVDAAEVWKKQFEPLKAKYGVKLGAPAMSGASTGFTWLQEWFTECAAIANNVSCEVDFIPAHWVSFYRLPKQRSQSRRLTERAVR